MKKLAMIGCGGIGSYHLDHFVEYTDVELAGFCDLIPERAEAFVKRAGSGKAYTDWRVMYDEVKPDMVFICVPPYAHGEIEFETIRRKIPFFVEKPLGLDLDLVYKIRDEVEAAGLITACGFQCRYSNIVPATQDFVKNNEVLYVGCARMGGMPGVEWWRDKNRSGGQIVEQTIHQYDMIRYIMGEPEQVFTMGARGFMKDIDGYDTDDLSATVIRFKSGALGTVATGCYATGGQCYDSTITFSARDSRLNHYIIGKVEVFGEKLAEPEENGLVFKGDGTVSAEGGEARVIKDDGSAGVICDRTFVDAVLTGDGSKIRSPYADAVKTMEFTLACNRSMDASAIENIENK